MAGEVLTKVAAAADASFLIGVSLVEQVSLLAELFERVYVAPAVWDEVVARGQGRPGAAEIASAGFIIQQAATNRQLVAMLQVFLGPGEAETLALAQELSCPLVLVDDLRARKAAQHAGLRTLGVVGFLVAVKRNGLVDPIKPDLETLLARGFRLGRTLIEAALKDAGEV